VANGLATDKSLTDSEKSPPVARLHDFSGDVDDASKSDDDLSIPAILRRHSEATDWNQRAEAGNGFAISGCGQDPEDRHPVPTQKVVRSPAISSGPDDDLDDFKIN
jgi:hypothetical protein